MQENDLVLVKQSDISDLIKKKEYLYGLKQVSAYLGICHTTASKLTNSTLKGTWFRTGKKLIFDKQLLIQALKEQSK